MRKVPEKHVISRYVISGVDLYLKYACQLCDWMASLEAHNFVVSLNFGLKFWVES